MHKRKAQMYGGRAVVDFGAEAGGAKRNSIMVSYVVVAHPLMLEVGQRYGHVV